MILNAHYAWKENEERTKQMVHWGKEEWLIIHMERHEKTLLFRNATYPWWCLWGGVGVGRMVFRILPATEMAASFLYERSLRNVQAVGVSTSPASCPGTTTWHDTNFFFLKKRFWYPVLYSLHLQRETMLKVWPRGAVLFGHFRVSSPFRWLRGHVRHLSYNKAGYTLSQLGNCAC